MSIMYKALKCLSVSFLLTFYRRTMFNTTSVIFTFCFSHKTGWFQFQQFQLQQFSELCCLLHCLAMLVSCSWHDLCSLYFSFNKITFMVRIGSVLPYIWVALYWLHHVVQLCCAINYRVLVKIVRNCCLSTAALIQSRRLFTSWRCRQWRMICWMSTMTSAGLCAALSVCLSVCSVSLSSCCVFIRSLDVCHCTVLHDTCQ